MVAKIKVAVLYGGRSGEHEVSLQSAASVVKNLDSDRFEIIPIGIDKHGHWRLGDMKKLRIENKTLTLPEFDGRALRLPSPKASVTMPPEPDAGLQPNDDHSHGLETVDVVFPVLHGSLGEDGTVQGLLELAEIAYVGPGVLGSAVGMDKDVAKRLAKAAGVSVANYIAFNHGQWLSNPEHWRREVQKQLNYPVFVKPANTGSSVGITKVKQSADLNAAIENAFLYDSKILIEQGVNAREIELSVLENIHYGQAPLVSIPGEIIPTHEFYSYEAKYLDPDGAGLEIPAKLSTAQVIQAQEIAKTLFTSLECEGMARVDLFLDRDSGQLIFNEVNTIPGFTQISMYPKLWAASGIEYKALLSHLIDLAIARSERKRKLKREWVA